MFKRWAVGLAFVLGITAVVVWAVPEWRGRAQGIMSNQRTHDGMPESYWIRSLQDPDDDVRKEAAFALGQIGPDCKEAIPALCTALKDDVPLVRINAALALFKIGPQDPAEIPALAEALEDSEPLVRLDAVMALSRFGPDAAPAVPALTAALGNKEHAEYMPPFALSIRRQTVRTLGRIGPDASAAIPAVLEVLAGAELDERLICCFALDAIGGPKAARQGVDVLIVGLEDKDPERRRVAAFTLSEMGSSAKPAVAALGKALHDPEILVRLGAAGALWMLERQVELVVGILMEGLQHSDAWTRRWSIDVLGRMGPEARQAVPALGKMLKDGSAEMRLAAVKTLGFIGPDAKSAVPQLIEALKDPGMRGGPSPLSTSAAESLRRIDPGAAARAGVEQ